MDLEPRHQMLDRELVDAVSTPVAESVAVSAVKRPPAIARRGRRGASGVTRSGGEAARPSAARCSGRTFTSPSTGMKLVSPFQRGTTCWWTCSSMPGAGDAADVPAEVEPVRRVLGAQRLDAARRERVHLAPPRRRRARRSRRGAAAARRAGGRTSTGTCSARRARARRRWTSSSSSGSQKMQRSSSSACWTYSRRHGAHSGFGIAASRASACSRKNASMPDERDDHPTKITQNAHDRLEAGEADVHPEEAR